MLTVLGSIRDMFRKTNKGSSGGGPRTSTLKDLVVAAGQAGQSVMLRMKWCERQSQSNGGQYLSRSGGPAIAMINLGGLARNIPGLSAAQVQRSVQFDKDYAAMVNGQGWAAYPNSSDFDNIDGLRAIGEMLANDAAVIAAEATMLMQQEAAQRRRTQLRGAVDVLGADAFAVIGEDFWTVL